MEGFSRVTDEYSLAYQLNTNHPPLSILTQTVVKLMRTNIWMVTYIWGQAVHFYDCMFFKSVDASVSWKIFHVFWSAELWMP